MKKIVIVVTILYTKIKDDKLKKSCNYIVPDENGVAKKIEVIDLSAFRNTEKMNQFSKATSIPFSISQILLSNKKIEAMEIDHLATIYSHKLKDIHHPLETYDSTIKSIELCKKFFATDANIGIYGDQDEDGVPSALILFETISQFIHSTRSYTDFSKVGEDGFGLSMRGAQNLLESGCKLIFVLDTGSSSEDTLQYLVDNGINVVVIDHHPLVDGINLVKNVQYIDPHLYVDKTPKPEELRNAGLTWYFGRKLLEELNGDVNKHYEYPLAISAIGTVADAGNQFEGIYNRGILHEGLKPYRLSLIPYFSELFGTQSIDMYNDLNKEEISRGYRILSLAKRSKNVFAGDVYTMLNLNSTDEQRAEIMEMLNKKYEEFLTIVDLATDELLKRINVDAPIIVDMASSEIVPDEWIGMSGTLASRVLSRLKKPAFLFVQDCDGSLKGSWRTGELSGSEMLSRVKEQNENIVAKFGGHSVAGGLLLKSKKQLFPLKFLLEQQMANTYSNKKTFYNNPNVEKKFVTVIFNSDEFVAENYSGLVVLAPFSRYEVRSVSLLLKDIKLKIEKENVFFSDGNGSIVKCVNNLDIFYEEPVDLIISMHILEDETIEFVAEDIIPAEYRLQGA